MGRLEAFASHLEGQLVVNERGLGRLEHWGFERETESTSALGPVDFVGLLELLLGRSVNWSNCCWDANSWSGQEGGQTGLVLLGNWCWWRDSAGRERCSGSWTRGSCGRSGGDRARPNWSSCLDGYGSRNWNGDVITSSFESDSGRV